MTSDNGDIERLLRVPSAAHGQVLGWCFILLAFAAVTVIGFRESDLLRRNTGLELIAFFRQGHSLRAGSKVLLAEVQIGEVQSVKLLHNPMADTDRIHVEVRMQIKGEYARTLPVGTLAEIRFGALEFANSVVLITPDTPTAEMLAGGAMIPAREGTDVVEAAKLAFTEVSRDLLAIVANLKSLSDGFTDSNGEYRKIVANLSASTNNAEKIFSRSRSAFESRRSVAGVLLNENDGAAWDVGRAMTSARRAADRVDSMTDSVARQMDTMTAIVGRVQQAADRLPSVVRQADSTLVAVEALTRKVGNSWLFRSGSAKTPNR